MCSCLNDTDFPSWNRSCFAFFLFAIILDPKQADIPGAFFEGEHRHRSQALMFSSVGGGLLAVMFITRLVNGLLLSQMCSSFHIRPVLICVPGEFCLLLMTPLVYQGGGRFVCVCFFLWGWGVNDASTHLTKQSH